MQIDRGGKTYYYMFTLKNVSAQVYIATDDGALFSLIAHLSLENLDVKNIIVDQVHNTV